MAEKGKYGFNGTISSKGHGSIKVRCVELSMGIGIITAGEGQAKRRKAFYPIVVTTSSFTMVCAFRDYSERWAFNRWMRQWMESVVDGTAQSGTMTVSVPSRNHLKICVPDGKLQYGEGWDDLAYYVPVSFIGATDPLNLDLGARQAGISYFKGPPKNSTSRFFYPAAQQVAGAESLDGTLFDTEPIPTGPDTNPDLDPFRGGGRPQDGI